MEIEKLLGFLNKYKITLIFYRIYKVVYERNYITSFAISKLQKIKLCLPIFNKT